MKLAAELDGETFTLQIDKEELRHLQSMMEYIGRKSNRERFIKKMSPDEIILAEKIANDAEGYLVEDEMWNY